jgi:molybdopterin-guanine dinucleotide biosynthesis protein B
MAKLISIVGKSNSGKTTLIEKLIPVFIGKGYKIATIKHDAHSFEIDKEGKDTYRHKKAGASAVIISSINKVAMIMDTSKELTLDDLCMLLPYDIDLIIIEGYKQLKIPKIEVFNSEISKELTCKNDSTLLAVVSDSVDHFALKDIKNKFHREAISEIADFIETYTSNNDQDDIYLYVNGNKIELNDFKRNIIISKIHDLLSSIKEDKNASQVIIRIDK